jgi:hypothetical protein
MNFKVETKDGLMVGFNILLTLAIVIAFRPNVTNGVDGSNGLPGSNGVNGSNGLPGSNGVDGEDGLTPTIGDNGNWFLGDEDTGVAATGDQQDVPFDYQSHVNSTYYDEALATYTEFIGNNNPVIANQTDYVAAKIAEGYVGIDSEATFFSAIANNPAGNFVLEKNLDFTNTEWDSLPVFSGTLDGANFTLSSLSLDSYTGSAQQRALFSEFSSAFVLNLTLDNFTMEEDVTNDSTGNAGLLAIQMDNSTLYNITINDSSRTGGVEIGLLASTTQFSNFYRIRINNSRVSARSYVGGVVYDSYGGSFFDIQLDDVTLEVVNEQAGLLAGNLHGAMVGEITVANSSVMFMPNVNDFYTNYYSIGLAIGATFGSMIKDILVFLTGIEFAPLGLESPQSLYNIGGIIGYGQYVTLLNAEYRNETIPMFTFPNDYVTNIEVEYIGGIVGYASNYVIMNAANDTSIFINDTLGVFSTSEDIGGIVGYSAGIGFMYRVVNRGTIQGARGVGGILGGVGFIVITGHITLLNALNYGEIYGDVGVGGLVGILDDLTGLTIHFSLSSGRVLGYEDVGGMVGQVQVIDPFEVKITSSIVRGQVFGITNVGGIIGAIFPDFEMRSTPAEIVLSHLVMEAEVRSMMVGVLHPMGEVTFNSTFNLMFHYSGYATGLIVGYRDTAIQAKEIFAFQPEVTVNQINFDENGLSLLSTTRSGRYENVGYGAALLEVIQFDHGYITFNEIFIDSLFGMFHPFIIENDSVGIEGFLVQQSPLLDAFGQELFFEPYRLLELNGGGPF